MPRLRSSAEILRAVPPRDRAVLRRFGLDLEDPAQARFFVEGVRVADEFIAEEAALAAHPSPPAAAWAGRGRPRAASGARGGDVARRRARRLLACPGR
ncbi:hypothetical protein [Sorangium sp. So ce117]|uniref:hypothetical protein n=1 Tax=Sorangium sp. So ce117 TaxID=3133277 RepID=UPI003F604CFC